MNKTGTAYILWAFCFFGIFGAHRLYNGKIGSGLLWLFTWGFFGVGQVVDLLLIPDMVREQNSRYLLRHGHSVPGIQGQTITIEQVDPPAPAPNQEDLMMKLLRAAADNQGCLSVTQGVLATGASFAEVEETLTTMLKTGYVGIDNDADTGIVIYRFIEL